jgi:hypothetical protein
LGEVPLPTASRTGRNLESHRVELGVVAFGMAPDESLDLISGRQQAFRGGEQMERCTYRVLGPLALATARETRQVRVGCKAP